MSGGPLVSESETIPYSMRETAPSVFLVARPSVDLDGMRAYLEAVGGDS